MKSIFYLSNEKYVSRVNFCKELQLGEGAVKTLIKHLKEFEIVDTIKAGTFLTNKGKRFANQFYKAIPDQTNLKKCDTTRGKYNYVAIIRKKFVNVLELSL